MWADKEASVVRRDRDTPPATNGRGVVATVQPVVDPPNSHNYPGRQLFTPEEWRKLQTTLSVSERQLEVLKCIFDDHVGAGMAGMLGISEHTVHTHLERLYRRMHVSSRGQLMVKVFATFLGRSEAPANNGLAPHDA
jgi:DNA-binding CsgD family transcriptional regulator